MRQNPAFSGAFRLDLPASRRYVRDTFRQAVSFVCSARPPGQALGIAFVSSRAVGGISKLRRQISTCSSPYWAAVSALFADPDTTIVEQFDGDEANLVDAFWRSIHRNDRVFAADVANGLSLLRERAWQLGVIPAQGIDLNTLYDLEEIDTTAMWGTDRAPLRPQFNPEAMLKLRNEFQSESFQSEYTAEHIVHSRD